MARFVAIYQNYADAAVLSGGSYLSGLPLSNAKTPSPGLVARTTSPLAAATQLVADLGAVRAVGGVAIGPINMTPGASYRIKASNSPSFPTPLVYDSGSIQVAGSTMSWSNTANWLAWEDPGFWFGIQDVFEQALVPVWAARIFSGDVSARFWKIEVQDSFNPAGYIQFGRVLIGRAFRPSVNYSKGAELTVEPIFQRVEAIGGERNDWDLNRRRALRVSFPDLSQTEMWTDVFRLSHVSGASKQVFVAPDLDDTSNFQRRSFLATLRAPPPLVQAHYARGTTVIDLEEVL